MRGASILAIACCALEVARALDAERRQHSELALLKIAHGYALASKRRKTPQITPPLPGERFEY